MTLITAFNGFALSNPRFPGTIPQECMSDMTQDSKHLLKRLKERTRDLRREVAAMYLALRHPATPWYAKVLAAGVVIYALSPVDLIPDPIPILGYLDDIVIVPLGVLMVRWAIPPAILEECRKQAAAGVTISVAWKWAGGIVVVLLWLLCLAWVGLWVWGWANP